MDRHVEEGDKIEDQHIDGMASMKEACESKALLFSLLKFVTEKMMTVI